MDAVTKDHLPKIDMIPDEEEYNKGWKKMKERTSSAPPIHFGHYRAPELGSTGSKVNWLIGVLPLMAGIVPDLWTECVNVMLIKKINDMRAEKLRMVTLLEAQYLQNSKIANRMMMYNAEKHTALAPEQYGSRKRKNSRTHCLNKRLVYDLIRLQHAIMILIANDLKSCYDRILMLIAFLTLTHLGIDEDIAIVLCVTMLEMKHRIRTTFGDSEFYYGGDKWITKPHGNGQGNGNGPGLWAGISSICLDIMREQGFGMEMTSAISEVAITLCGFAFVDDTNLIQNGETSEEVLIKAQGGLKLWEQLMRATGGALEPDKSDWVMVDYQMKNGKWTLQPIQEERVLEVRGPDDNIKPLKQLKPTDARETLGIWQAPTGNEDTQVEKLTELINKWCTGMQSRFLPSHEVETAIRSTISRKIHYCLVATNMTKAQCKEIIDPVVRRVMPRMKLARNTCRTVVHAPTELLGVGIDDPFISQIVEHIKEIINVGNTSKHTGILLDNVLEEHLLETGIGGQITKWDMTWTAEIMTESWLRDTLIQMQFFGIEVRSNHQELQLWREHDQFIMDIAMKQLTGTGRININQLRAINKCRKYMNVCTISDLTDGSGRYILTDTTRCKKMDSTSSNAYTWHRQAKPNQNEIGEWKEFLRTITRSGKELRQHLGKWKQSAITWKKWRFNETYDRLYHQDENGKWRVWSKNHSRTRRKKYQKTDYYADQEEISNAKIPVVHITERSTIAQLDGYASTLNTNESATFENTIEELKHQGWIIRTPQLLNEERIVELLKRGEARIICDGSTDEGKSSSGTIIFDDEEDLYRGGNHVPGPAKEQNSYRSELAGLINGVITVNVICKRNNITNGRCTIGCDNDSALDMMFKIDDPLCTQSSYDLLRILRYHMKRSPIQWVKRKVQGHQDKDTPYIFLDEWGRANVRADRLAKKYMTTHPTEVLETRAGGEGWSVYINGEKVTMNISKRLYKHCTHQGIKEYWAIKTYIDMDEYDAEAIDNNIEWDALKSFSKIIPGHQRRWITKHLSHNSATGFVMGPARRKERKTDKCPLCDFVETSNHVIQCNSQQSRHYFDQALVTLVQWMEENTQWDIAEAIMEIILSVREKREISVCERWSPEVKRAAILQEEMSCRALVSGLLHTEWKAIHTTYAEKLKLKMKPNTFMTLLIKMIWDIQWSIWKERCTYLHNKEEARKKILAANIDEDIDEFYDNIPPNTWMTPAQRSILSIPKQIVQKYKSRRKIKWLRRAKKMCESHKNYISRMQNSTSAQRMRDWFTNPSQVQIQRYNEHRAQRLQIQLNQEEEAQEEPEARYSTLQQLNITQWLKGNAADDAIT